MRLYKSAIDYVGCALFFCYIFAHYSSLKPILIYAKLYVSCVLKGEHYLYLCNAINHPKNTSNVVFSPQQSLNKSLKAFQFKATCSHITKPIALYNLSKPLKKPFLFYIKEKYNRSQITLFSKAFFMFSRTSIITYHLFSRSLSLLLNPRNHQRR